MNQGDALWGDCAAGMGARPRSLTRAAWAPGTKSLSLLSYSFNCYIKESLDQVAARMRIARIKTALR